MKSSKVQRTIQSGRYTVAIESTHAILIQYRCYPQTSLVFVSFYEQHESDPCLCHQLVPLQVCHHPLQLFLSVKL